MIGLILMVLASLGPVGAETEAGPAGFGTGEGGQPVTLTAQQIVAAWDKGLKPLKAIHHQSGNFIVDTTQNEADVFCYGIASHYLPNKTNQNTRVFVGSYNFHLIKNGATWQIDQFKFNLKYIDGNPNLEGS